MNLLFVFLLPWLQENRVRLFSVTYSPVELQDAEKICDKGKLLSVLHGSIVFYDFAMYCDDKR